VSDTAESSTASIRYLSGNPRAQVIDLAEPVEVNGTTYTSFTVRRLTARDLEEHRRKTPEEREAIPVVNCDIAKEVLDVLDADDADRLQAAAYDFLPLSWRAAFELSQSTLGPTPSSSDDGPVTDSTEASTATGSTS
jgi:hypothetical protein